MNAKTKIISKLWLSAFVIIGLSFAFSASAVVIENPLEFDTFEELVEHIIQFFVYIGVPVCILVVLIGAFYIMTSGGDAKRRKAGGNMILYAAIGLGIILFARGLISFLKYLLGA